MKQLTHKRWKEHLLKHWPLIVFFILILILGRFFIAQAIYQISPQIAQNEEIKPLVPKSRENAPERSFGATNGILRAALQSIPFIQPPLPDPDYSLWLGSSKDIVRIYVRGAAQNQGINPDIAECIVIKESQLDPNAIGDSGESRGIWQINERWNPDVDDNVAFSVQSSTEWALKKIKEGKIKHWSTYSLFCAQYNIFL